MRKLFKKSLACVLAVALCLTAMVGVLTVSAADALKGTILIGDATIAEDGATATVPITFSVTDENAVQDVDVINAGYINLAVEGEGATVNKIYDDKGDCATNAAKTMFELDLDATGASGKAETVVNIVIAITAETESFKVTVNNKTSATASEKLIDFGEATKEFTIEEPACEHAETTTAEEVTKAATCTEAGSKTVTVTCKACGEVVSTTTEVIPATGAHNFVDGSCTVCGEEDPNYEPPVEECKHANTTFVSATPAASGVPGKITLHCNDCDTTLPAADVTYRGGYRTDYITAVYKSEVLLNFSAREDYLKYFGSFTDVYAVITKPMANGDEPKVYVKNISEAEYAPVNGTACYTWSIGLPAKEYTDKCSVYVYLKDEDGVWYSGQNKGMSMAEYCQAVLAMSSTTEKEKVLIANVLNYGAKAQVNFENYHVDDLATNYLGEYSDLITEGIPTISNTSTTGQTPVTNVALKSINAVCKSKVLMHVTYQLRPGYETASLNLEALLDGDDAPMIFVNESIATAEQIKNGEYFYTEGSYIAIDYSGFAAKDLRKKATITPVDTELGQVGKPISYSIEDLIAGLLAGGLADSKPAEAEMYYAMLNYSDAAAAMFS